ncbi:PAS domain S-box protein [Winogradskyella undariae]|uniref:PAS domain-containing sensor histidine kinase n=1 Tax=Winogradskyella TaxID=286104 RepID=UPI00156B9376|nr:MULTISPECIES: PAS domain-containing sensor histidine kinase [Winogradskyella]NRR91087.1 PAS domain S-box protein [Winogradskyella undariae]QXP79967.1 PAS domain S-box protein [Winogradskyella sp. HaHa_3_26]
MSIPNIQKKSSINLLDFIQEHAAIGTWEFDTTLSQLNWSTQTKKIHEVSLDYKPNVELGLSFYKKGYSLNKIETLFTNCIENHKDFDIEIQIITQTGKEKWVRTIGTPIIENNKCIKIQGLIQDIDKKTKNSKALAIKEQQLSRTFETALVGMAIVDLEGTLIDVNKSLCKTLGYNKDEIKTLTFMDLTHPDDLRRDYAAMMRMISGKLDHYEAEKRYINKKGEIIWAQLFTTIVRDSNGQPEHFIAQINDLTLIKKSSQKVSQLLDTTENQNKRLLNFAHIVSHNLRSHYGNLDMLLDIIKMDSPETTKNEIFPLIEQAVNNLGETVKNLNEVAAINTQKDLKTESLNLLENFNKAFSSISALIINSETKISINIEPEIFVKGIPAYLDSILLNFLTNAIKYKKINEPAKIEINTEIENDFVILKIKDYGLGIDLKKHRDKLFGMYKTFHKHKDSRGLGLFITKNQVEAIGGKIEVESIVNESTTFYIYLKTYE